MNWFQRIWNNPNMHVAAAMAAGAASIRYPEYKDALATVAGVLGASGILLPEQAPVLKPAPPAAPTGSMHGIDYIQMAAAFAEAMKKK
jgi:hypothetical protein